MENFKFFLFSVFIILLLIAGGYWAFSTMETGTAHIDNEKLRDLENENEDLKDQISDLKEKVTTLESEKIELDQTVKNEAEQKQIEDTTSKQVETKQPVKTTTSTSKYQTLINDLQKIVNAGIYLKEGSQGPYVGTVQKFLNVYNGTSNKIDNDFGATTKTAIKNFQKAQGLSADGGVASGTLNKMISWLKSRS